MKNHLLFKAFLIIITPTLLLSSCTKENDPTTYTIAYNVNADLSFDYTQTITCFEYNEQNERIAYQTIDNCKEGYSETFTANENTKKVKLHVRINANIAGNEIEKSWWIQQVFYLIPNENTLIEIQNNSITGSREP